VYGATAIDARQAPASASYSAFVHLVGSAKQKRRY
jgi:hypothetical protein